MRCLPFPEIIGGQPLAGFRPLHPTYSLNGNTLIGAQAAVLNLCCRAAQSPGRVSRMQAGAALQQEEVPT